MKKKVKNILFSVLYIFIDKYLFLSFKKSPNLFKLFWYSTRFRLASKGIYINSNEKKLKQLKNKYTGKRCVIIGNGPSLNELDLTLLKNEYTFGVNAIYLNYDKMQFSPTFYVVEDYLVAEDRASEINSYNKSQVKFFGTYLDYILKKDEKTINLNVPITSYGKKHFKPYFATDCIRRIGVGGTVTYMCLQLAYYMGFTEVYMIGFDHNYTVPKGQDYDKNPVIKSNEDDINHFAPGYFGKGYRWHDPKVDRMEEGFKIAKIFFDQDGRKIYNATKGGKLEVFERVNYNEVFGSNIKTTK